MYRIILEPTQKQLDVLNFIIDYINTSGVSPTLQEITVHFGYKSHYSVKMHLFLLTKKGYLNIAHGVTRGIAIRNTFSGVPRPWKQSSQIDGAPYA